MALLSWRLGPPERVAICDLFVVLFGEAASHPPAPWLTTADPRAARIIVGLQLGDYRIWSIDRWSSEPRRSTPRPPGRGFHAAGSNRPERQIRGRGKRLESRKAHLRMAISCSADRLTHSPATPSEHRVRVDRHVMSDWHMKRCPQDNPGRQDSTPLACAASPGYRTKKRTNQPVMNAMSPQ